jgi:uncharacterized MAPEG superfamily protein
MPNTSEVSMEMTILLYAIVLGLIQLFAQVGSAALVRGPMWAAGTRDEKLPELPKVSARLERSFYNFMETFPFFVAAILLLQFAHRNNATSFLGAEIYLAARVLYIPIYVLGIPFVRSLTWVVSIVGIAMILMALF